MTPGAFEFTWMASICTAFTSHFGHSNDLKEPHGDSSVDLLSSSSKMTPFASFGLTHSRLGPC